MSFKFQIIGTGSSGNCTVLKTPLATILLDAGISGRRTKSALNELGISLGNVDAIFFTHDHCDHFDGVKGILAEKAFPRFFANKATAAEISRKTARNISWDFFVSGTTFEFRDLQITPFSIPHDAADACGFVFQHGNEKFAWLTDCGKITNVVRQKLSDVDFLVIESNFDPVLLNRSNRPEQTKERIRGPHGHLSNFQCAEFLSELENPRLRQVFFGHISEECNSREKILETSFCVAAKKCERVEIVLPSDFLSKNGGFGF